MSFSRIESEKCEKNLFLLLLLHVDMFALVIHKMFHFFSNKNIAMKDEKNIICKK